MALMMFVVVGCGDDDTDTAATPTPAATQPVSVDIVATAVSVPTLSTLVKAVTAAELVETLQGAGPFTVFAPTNAAFEALPEGTLADLLKPENKDKLASILTYHVVPGSYTAADLKDGQKLKTVQGDELTVKIDGDMVKIVGDGSTAMVEKADTNASNGTVHVIDTVLLPPS